MLRVRVRVRVRVRFRFRFRVRFGLGLGLGLGLRLGLPPVMGKADGERMKVRRRLDKRFAAQIDLGRGVSYMETGVNESVVLTNALKCLLHKPT